MEGPYRDLGAGFARLTGAEGARRAPPGIAHVEDALLELLRNARDAGASNIYVASTLKGRRYRTLTVLDDGGGIPDAYAERIFDAGVTTRHLNPIRDDPRAPHGAGLALYHIKNAALEARVMGASSPTSIRVVLDTRRLPERALQSASRPSRTNLLATTRSFAAENRGLALYHASPARILATLVQHRIIQRRAAGEMGEEAVRLGLRVSLRTVQRVKRGEIPAARRVGGEGDPGRDGKERGEAGGSAGGPVVYLGERDRAEIEAILSRAARASYLELGELRLESRPGEISLTARVNEPEEEYE